MRVLAIIEVAPNSSIDVIRAELENELREAWRLYSSGVLREAYATDPPTRVVFVLEAQDMTRAEEILSGLPLIASGLMRASLVELRPFTNWSALRVRAPGRGGKRAGSAFETSARSFSSRLPRDVRFAETYHGRADVSNWPPTDPQRAIALT